MRDLKTAMIACACVVFLSIAGIAIWTVRAYLPIVGIVLLVVLIIGVLLALAYVVIHLHHKFSRYEHIQISQYGSVLARRNQLVEIAPYYALPPARASRASQPDEDYIEGQIEPLEEMPALLPPVLSFSQLLERGIIQAALAQGKMLLGYYADTQEIRYGSWLDLYSCGIGGVSGSGKSTTVRFLLFQAVLAHARFIFIDPHIGDEEESLAAQFRAFPGIHQFPPCDTSTRAVLQRVQWLKKEFDRRKKTGLKTPFLILVIDEFNAVMRSKEIREELSELLLSIEQEARKFGIFAMLLAQRWSSQDLGGADIRTSLASFLAHRFTDEDQARKLVGSRNGPRCLELNTGHWFFRDTKGGLKEMVTPETLSQDGQMVARFIGQPGRETSAESSWKPRENILQIPETTRHEIVTIGPRNLDESSDFEPETNKETSRIEELARVVIRLQASGMQKPDIMRQVWKVNPGGSEAYKVAQEEYQSIMSYIAEQLGA